MVGGVTHLTGEGFAGAGGSVVGANTVCVSDKTAGSTFGGMTKWMVSSLRKTGNEKARRNIRKEHLHSNNKVADVGSWTPSKSSDFALKFPSLNLPTDVNFP